jgi:putative transposase
MQNNDNDSRKNTSIPKRAGGTKNHENNLADKQPTADAGSAPKKLGPYNFPPRTPPKKFLPHEVLIAIRRVQAGLPVSELCRELGMSNSTFYKWRTKYNGMSDPLLLRMKRLQDHNDKLRQLYVDEKLRAETLYDALQVCSHEKVDALKELEAAHAQLEGYRNVTWTKKEPGKPAGNNTQGPGE